MFIQICLVSKFEIEIEICTKYKNFPLLNRGEQFEKLTINFLNLKERKLNQYQI